MTRTPRTVWMRDSIARETTSRARGADVERGMLHRSTGAASVSTESTPVGSPHCSGRRTHYLRIEAAGRSPQPPTPNVRRSATVRRPTRVRLSPVRRSSPFRWSTGTGASCSRRSTARRLSQARRPPTRRSLRSLRSPCLGCTPFIPRPPAAFASCPISLNPQVDLMQGKRTASSARHIPATGAIRPYPSPSPTAPEAHARPRCRACGRAPH
jgi:hypothetical protein